MNKCKKIFNLDLHISVIADVKNIVSQLYPTDQIQITDWCISGHSWVFNRQPDTPEIVNANTWRGINTKMIQEFVEKYKDYLSHFDCFIVTHTPVFCRLFESFGKPIILVNSCRYEQPYCWTGTEGHAEWLKTIECFKTLTKKNLLTVVNNNLADKEYFERSTGVETKHIPSLCLYTSVMAPETPFSDIVVYSNGHTVRNLGLKNTVFKEHLPRWEYSQMFSAKLIIHIPYEISTMSIFEQYSAGVPMAFPTKELLAKLWNTKMINFNGPYTKQWPAELELSECLGGNSETVEFWLSRADYYDQENFAGCYYFNTFQELKDLCENFVDYKRAQRLEHIAKRKDKVFSEWKTIFDSVFEFYTQSPVKL